MKTDVQIAQEAQMKPIVEVASQLDISDDELELYGKYKAKISPDVLERLKDRPNGKLVLVTAINPTPAGEGKTTTNVGLSMALNKLGKKTITTLREPSLGPCFCIKAALPAADIPRWYRWMISTCILPGISMPSLRHTTCWRQCWITTSTREMRWIS